VGQKSRFLHLPLLPLSVPKFLKELEERRASALQSVR
jgi:hypothetical protein